MKERFQTFKDGNCTIHLIDEEGNAGTIREKLRFEDRTIGYKRFIESMTAKMQTDRLIRIHSRKWITTEYLAVIDGEVYEIRQVQKIKSISPESMDLSLHLSRQRVVSDGTVSGKRDRRISTKTE